MIPYFVKKRVIIGLIALIVSSTFSLQSVQAQRLPGTECWTAEGESAVTMIEGIDRFLLRQTETTIQNREKHWKRDFSSPFAYGLSIRKNSEELAWMLGLRDARVAFESPELITTLSESAKIGECAQYDILRIRWVVLEGVTWEGLLLEPKQSPIANVIALPDAGQSPEMMVGLQPGIDAKSRFAIHLAKQSVRVVIPAVISRKIRSRTRKTELTDREFLHRTCFEMGRHPSGYEIQAINAITDWLKAAPARAEEKPIALGAIGWGEGGRLALLSAALDSRIDAAFVSGYFAPREQLWQEPIDRTLFGFLEQFGDAELATMITPRAVFIEPSLGPEAIYKTAKGAPGKLVSPKRKDVLQEFERAKKLLNNEAYSKNIRLVVSDNQPENNVYLSADAIQTFLATLLPDQKFNAAHADDKRLGKEILPIIADLRQQRLVNQITAYNQNLMEHSDEVRRQFFKNMNSTSLVEFKKSIEPYRDYFRKRVIGEYEQDLLPARPRSRKILDHEKWTAYEVMLDVFPDVFASGILIMPKNIKPGEKRPVVVCQHGLEGTPMHLVQADHRAYHDYAAKLAEQGVITFSPQNPYIGKDRFRTLQQKSYPLGKTLFSVIVPQHQQITNWLGKLPQVDAKRIAFYGLSYGGKSAMRIPPLVDNYCLSICAGDFNDWIRKTITTIPRYTYVWTGEYEMYEFDLGNTFNYAEMAALIAPKPFMVERGHFDGVAPDEWVAAEFAKVRNLYQARLKLKGQTEIEWFDGPHAINADGTFRFLSKHLNYPIKPIGNYK